MSEFTLRTDAVVSSPLRLALATVQFSNVGSGPGTFTRYLWESADTLHDIVFFTEDADEASATNRLVPLRPRPRLRPLSLFTRSLAYHRALRREERRRSFDLVWFNTQPPLALASVLAGHVAPVVLMVSDYSNAVSRWPWSTRQAFGGRRAASRSVLRQIERLALRKAAATIANSGYTRDMIVTEYDLDPEKVHVLPKGVDLSLFEAEGKDPKLAAPARILFLKSDFMLGGLVDLFAALSSFDYPFELTVAGPSKSDLARIRRLARTAGYSADFRFAARVARDAVPALMRSHDILCVPSRAEALGVVFLEALAAGMAVVGTKVGGIPEVLDQGRAGWMVEPYDAEGLRATLVSLIESDAERRNRIAAGRRHVRKYSVEVMMANFWQLAERLRRTTDVKN